MHPAKRWRLFLGIPLVVVLFVLVFAYLSSEERIVIELEPLQVQNLSSESRRSSVKNTRLELTFDVQNRLQSASISANFRMRLFVRGSGKLLPVSPRLDSSDPKCGLEALDFRPIENSDNILEFSSNLFPRVHFMYENGKLWYALVRFRDW